MLTILSLSKGEWRFTKQSLRRESLPCEGVSLVLCRCSDDDILHRVEVRGISQTESFF